LEGNIIYPTIWTYLESKYHLNEFRHVRKRIYEYKLGNKNLSLHVLDLYKQSNVYTRQLEEYAESIMAWFTQV